jgi:hypothetical protein
VANITACASAWQNHSNHADRLGNELNQNPNTLAIIKKK